MQVVPGVYLVNGYPYGRHQNCYVVRAAGAAIRIDCGDLTDDSFETVRAGCARWGIAMEGLSHLLVTHAHFDHSSHAARLQRAGLRIVAAAGTAAAMAAGDDRCIGYAVHRTFEPCHTDLVVADGQDVSIEGLTVRCIAAPGHAEGLVIYEIVLNGERLWFCGDLVEMGAECATLELGWAGGPDYEPRTYVETLRRLARMECDTLLPGHGPAGIGFGRRIIQMAYTRALLDLR
jgi:metallo-beta-lactamase class B